MREIKFKAKSIYGGWVFGHYYTDQRFIDGVPGVDVCIIKDEDGQEHFVKEETLCQYTGLKDKNGVEIYEGDKVFIFHRHNKLFDGDGFYTDGVVEFECGNFWINGDGYSIIQHFHYDDEHREVTGNIHDK